MTLSRAIQSTMVLALLLSLSASIQAALGFRTVEAADTEWPQVQRDQQRTGHSTETLGTGFAVAWTHPFQPERVYPQVQAIVHRSTVFVGTESGNIYALDARTGSERWIFKAGGPILGSVAARNGTVFFGAMDGAVYALETPSGSLAWKRQLSRRGFSTAPVLADDLVMLGSRDGDFFALSPDTGDVIWSYRAGAPILQTAAADAGRVFFGAMDMHVYALQTRDGTLAWKSERLPGTALKDYWPVVYRGKVLVIPTAGTWDPGISPAFPFGWHDDWNWISRNGPIVATGNLVQLADVMYAQQAVMDRYRSDPTAFTKSLFILDEADGNESVVVPHFSAQTMHGATSPPAIDRDGMLVVPVMFIRSGWGRLDLNSQRIVDILFDGKDWNGRPLAAGQLPAGAGNSDENLNVSTSANVVLGFHTQEMNANYTGAFDQNARRWIPISRGWTNGEMWNNTQGGGGNPASISDGMNYHISTHELIARTAQ